MTLSFLPKKLAFLSLSFTVSTSIVNASDIEELASKKLIIAFDVSPEKKTPSLRNVSDFCTWQEVFEKASSEIAKKYNYLKCLRGVEINGIFDGIESNRTFLKKTADYQAQTKFKELDI